MPYDIYGEHLQRGHCEVHPWVHEEYPCGICCSEMERTRRERAEADEHWAAMRLEQESQESGNQEFDSWQRSTA